MSGDRLVGEGLLAAASAAQAALDAGAPAAGSSEARFIAAMIARTRDLAKRDQALASDIAERESAIITQFSAGKDLGAVVAAIRAGRLDGDAALHQALYKLAILRMQATKPEALATADRQGR